MPWDLNGNNLNVNASNFLGTRNDVPLIIKTNADNAPANLEEVMRVTPSSPTRSGSVGIGTPAPTAKLHVDGSGTLGPALRLVSPTVEGLVVESDGTCIVANSFSGSGIIAFGRTGPGLGGAGGDGVAATAADNTLFSAGVRGTHTGFNGNGVIGHATNGSDAFGVWGISPGGGSGFAGVFDGNVQVRGTLTKAAGGFLIDHPLFPEDKTLYHSFMECNEAVNVYSGNVITDDAGHATVTLPNYFEVLNRDFRYQLTVIGELAVAAIAQEITDNQFTVRTDRPNVKVSWQVTGVRQDAYAEMYRSPVEADKPPDQRGTYLYPEVFGQATERGAHFARMQALTEHEDQVDQLVRSAQFDKGE
jgi:hypothetical protein